MEREGICLNIVANDMVMDGNEVDRLVLAITHLPHPASHI